MSASPPTPPSQGLRTAVEVAIERVLEEARIARMTERDPHYRYLLTILTLSHRTQQLASDVMASAKSFEQTHEKMRRDWSEFGKRREAQSPPADASPPQTNPGDDLKFLAGVLVVALIIFAGGYMLGDREVLGSYYTPIDRLRRVFKLDDLSIKTLNDLISLNDLHQIDATCKARAAYRLLDDRRDCSLTLVVPPPSERR